MTEHESPAIRSVRGIIVESDAVALIARHRGDEHFFVFPGGSVEPGETTREALIREVSEETGLVVAPDRIVATVTFPDRIQEFWLANVTSGQFGNGIGLEVSGVLGIEFGTYVPIWLPICEVRRSRILPVAIAQAVSLLRDADWPLTPSSFVEDHIWRRP